MRISDWSSDVCASDLRLVHHLADFFGVAFRQRAAENGEVLTEDIDEAAVDRPRAGDDAIARNLLILHPEIDAIMLDIGIEFFERAFVKQHVEPLASGQLALAVLRVAALLPAPQRGGRAAAFHFGDMGGNAALHDRSEE